jgi:hypothetical protein
MHAFNLVTHTRLAMTDSQATLAAASRWLDPDQGVPSQRAADIARLAMLPWRRHFGNVTNGRES